MQYILCVYYWEVILFPPISLNMSSASPDTRQSFVNTHGKSRREGHLVMSSIVVGEGVTDLVGA